ncbi:MAG: ABC transporter permease [Coriobacteriia bacterium]|nr:ABC transporter permease [Coriobacteriia bacterium]
MRRFLILLKKELGELMTLQTLLPFVVVVLMFMGLGQTLSSVSADAEEGFTVAVADHDGGELSGAVMAALEQAGLTPVATTSTIDDTTAADVFDDADANIAIEIPQGFSAALASGEQQRIESWARIESFTFVGNEDIASLAGALEMVNSTVAAAIAAEAAPEISPALLQRPVVSEEHVVVGANTAEASADAVMAFVSQQTMLIPMVLFLVIVFAAQMIASAVATEKENKTLETLLSYPVSRTSIVTSKMVAAGLVALLAAGAYMFGMSEYMGGIESSFTAGPEAQAAIQASDATMRQLGLTFSTGDYFMLGLTLFASILTALAIAIILGAFAEDVKSVGALIMPLMVLLLIPYFLTIFLDLSVLPDVARYAVLAIPFTYPFITGPNLFLGNYGIVWWGIGYQLVWFAVFVTIAARVFSSDRILTMKLSLGKRKK